MPMMEPNPNYDGHEIIGEVVSAPSFPACLTCVSEYILANNKWLESGQPDGLEPVYEMMVLPAVTMAPSWQSQAIGGQMAMACVALPSCLKHLGVREKTPMERASENGLMVPVGLAARD
jgi:hypothetical protein